MVNSILVRIEAKMVPHDSPEFIEHAKKGRPPIPDWMRRKPTPDAQPDNNAG